MLHGTRIALLGDLVVPDTVQEARLDALADHAYDLAICNLEGSFIGNRRLHKIHNLCNSPDALEELLAILRIECVNLANNHVMDFRVDGLANLMAFLDNHGVSHFGAGVSYSEAIKPTFADINGTRIGLVGFAWRPIEAVGSSRTGAGVALIPPKTELRRTITEVRKHCDHAIVSFHWGYEYERYPLPLHRKLAHAAVDAGASVIMGHHPHVYQGIESYNGSLIYYSLGNSYMPWPVKEQGDVGIVPILEFNATSVSQVAVLYAVRSRSDNSFGLFDSFRAEPTLDALSEPLSLDDGSYEHFFRLNRTRRKGLPVFTGSRWDAARYVWLDVRSCLVRTAVRIGLWPKLSG